MVDTNQAKIEKLEQQIAQHRARLSDLKTKATKQQRKDEARRKIIYGHAYLTAVAKYDEGKRKQSLERLHAFITRSTDRAFLNLKPLGGEGRPDELARSTGTTTSDLPFGTS